MIKIESPSLQTFLTTVSKLLSPLPNTVGLLNTVNYKVNRYALTDTVGGNDCNV